jgi:glyoxylase-like metal-dependent hydrolase (beta-lactamase superfamily II)
MLIRILGTRGEVEPTLPYHSRHSGVLVDNALLLDLGEREFLECQPKSVFITHLHPDHAFFVREKTAITIPVPVYAPRGDDSRTTTALSEPIQIERYRITPIPTHHSKLVSSQAYLVDDGHARLLYTGDMVWINKEYHYLFRQLALVITDGSYLRRGGMIRRDKDTGQIYGHAGIPNLIRMFTEYTRDILFVHFGAWFYESAQIARKRLEQLGHENAVKVIAGYDGMELQLDD